MSMLSNQRLLKFRNSVKIADTICSDGDVMSIHCTDRNPTPLPNSAIPKSPASPVCNVLTDLITSPLTHYIHTVGRITDLAYRLRTNNNGDETAI
jgi:hypothetical protein